MREREDFILIKRDALNMAKEVFQMFEKRAVHPGVGKLGLMMTVVFDAMSDHVSKQEMLECMSDTWDMMAPGIEQVRDYMENDDG